MPVYRLLLYRHNGWVDSVIRNLKDDLEAFELANALDASAKIEGWRDNKLVFSMNEDGSANPTA
ncbi:MAG TPA: hypothetical protein VKB67_14585 [Rhizomicrobium sp.]|nr:hypothetical protein [Rhizomicrobium sp.]